MFKVYRSLVIAAAALSATGCQFMDHVFAPAHPETTDWVQFAPPAWYRTLYVQAEQCSGLHRNYETLRFFYHVQRDSTDYILDSDGKHVLAMEDSWSRRIWIGSESLADPMVVEHEMMHYLLDGVNGHPVEYFEQSCHLRPWAYTEADWSRDHDMMSAFYQSFGSLDLPIYATSATLVGTGGSSADQGVPPGAE
jgi:hypothetical protein